MSEVSLYTAKDVSSLRKLLYNEQLGIDPILQESIEFTSSVLDHDHESQRVRKVLHRQTNSFEGKVYNAYLRCLKWVTEKDLPSILRSLADYYDLHENANNSPFHPGWQKKVSSMFNKLNESQKDKLLVSLGFSKGSNVKERKALFRAATLDRDLGYLKIKEAITKVKESN